MPLNGLWPTNCGVNGCETIVLRLIDVRKKLVVTRDRTGVDIVAAGFGWVCTVLMFSWCGLIG